MERKDRIVPTRLISVDSNNNTIVIKKISNGAASNSCPVHFVNIGQDVDLHDDTTFALYSNVMSEDVIGNNLRYAHNIINNDFNTVAAVAEEKGSSFEDEYGINLKNIKAMRHLDYRLDDTFSNFINSGVSEFTNDTFCLILSDYLDHIRFFEHEIDRELYSTIINYVRTGIISYRNRSSCSYTANVFAGVKVNETSFLNTVILLTNEIATDIVSNLLSLSRVIAIGFGLNAEEYAKFSEDSYIFINNMILKNMTEIINNIGNIIETATAVYTEYKNSKFIKTVNKIDNCRYKDYEDD